MGCQQSINFALQVLVTTTGFFKEGFPVTRFLL
jgi:hypothetical protein